MTTLSGWTDDLVVIDFTFADETFGVSEPMPRWVAKWVLRVIGEYGEPYRGKRVVRALLIPRDAKVH